MSINFLAEKNRKSSRKGNNAEEIIEWAEPGKEKKEENSRISREKSNIFFKKLGTKSLKNFVSGFFRKPRTEKGDSEINKVFRLKDKKKIKKSRRELLDFIAKQKKPDKDKVKPEAKASSERKATETKEKKERKWLSELLKKLRVFFSARDSKTEEKEVLVDYQKALKEEKEKNRPGKEALADISAAKKAEAAVQEESREEEKERAGLGFNKILALFKGMFQFKRAVDSGVKQAQNIVVIQKTLPEEEAEKKMEKKAETSQEKRNRKEDEMKIEGENFEAPQVLKTNLIKDGAFIFFDWQKNIIMLFIFIILSLGFVGGVYWGLTWWSQRKESDTRLFEKEISQLDKKTEAWQEEIAQINDFKEKLKKINALLDQHIYWNNFFSFMEANTLSEIYFEDFSGINDGSYSLSARAKDFKAIEAQVKQFLSDRHVLSVKVEGGSLKAGEEGEDNTVGFSLDLSVDPSIFIE